MTDELKQLPPAEKKVAAKVLAEKGYSTRQLEDLLGEDHTTLWRASKEATPEELKQFETDFRLAIEAMKCQGIALVQKRLLELVPKERKISEVVKAGEYLEGRGSTPGSLTQFNIDGEKLEVKVVNYNTDGDSTAP